jgi:hypothetical protein
VGLGQFVVPVSMTAGITRYRTRGPTLVEDAQRNPCFVIAEMGAPASQKAEALRPGPAQMDLQAIAALELAEVPLAETHARFTAC